MQPWIEIIDEQRLEERVAEEPENADLFGELPNGGTCEKRLQFVERHVFGLGDIFGKLARGRRHVVLSLGRRIVAIAGVQVDHKNSAVLSVTHVSVEEKHRGKGYGRAIVEAVFPYAIERGQMVDPSTYSNMGKERIRHVFEELHARFPETAVRP